MNVNDKQTKCDPISQRPLVGVAEEQARVIRDTKIILKSALPLLEWLKQRNDNDPMLNDQQQTQLDVALVELRKL